MDDNFQDIIDSLPEKRSRSRLEPYGKLIDELLRRGWTYRGIAGILAKKFQLKVSISTIHDFVRLVVLLPDEDDAGSAWAKGIAKQWADDLQDSRQDIYTLEDGQSMDAAR
jgi:hypothetical protein